MTATHSSAQRSEPRTVASPYKGLSFYGERDAPFFFGREAEISIIAANLLASRLTLLYGPSGVGKSSLLRAGVASHLRTLAAESLETAGKPGSVVVVFPADVTNGSDRRVTWRDDPLEALAAGIESAVAELGVDVEPVDRSLRFAELLEAWSDRLDGDVLLVLDQFEEYFLYHGDEEGERTLFEELPRALNRGTSQANVLISIREDAYARLDRFKGRIPFLYDNYLRIDHLDRTAAHAATVRPIEEWNRRVAAENEHVEIEPELVEAVLDDVQTGNVVLGQSGRGIVGHGEGREPRIETPFLQLVLERLWTLELAAGSRLLRLETLERLGGAERIVRTHLDEAMNELAEEDKELAARVLRHLVTPSGTKIAHLASDLAALENVPPEPLARVLETLAAARILRPVAPPPGEIEPRYEIFHDVLAPAVLDWRARYVRVREQERLEQAKLETREAKLREKHERRRARLFGALALAALAALVALVLGFAWHQKRAADSERERSQSRAAAAEAIRLLDGRLDDSLMRVLEARDHAETVEARSAQLTALQQTNGLVRFLRFPQPVKAVAAGPGGTFAVALDDGTLVFLDRSGRRIGSRPTEQSTIDAIAFDPRRPLLAAGLGRTVKLLELRKGTDGQLSSDEARVMQVDVDQQTIRSVAFSPDGHWLATGGEGGLTLWKLDSKGRADAVGIEGSEGSTTAVAFGGGSRPLLAATSTSGLRLWDLEHRQRGPRSIARAAGNALAFVPDGSLLATTGRGSVWLGSPGGAGRRRGPGLSSALAFDRSGAMLAAGDARGRVVLWDVARGRMIGQPIRAQASPIVSLAFEPDSGVLAVASGEDHTVALWDAAVRERFGSNLALAAGGLSGVATGRDGRFAALTRSGALAIRDLESDGGRSVAAQGVERVAASGDGRWLIALTTSGMARAGLITDPSLLTLQHRVPLQDVSISHDGRAAAAARSSPSVLRWEAVERRPTTLEPPAATRDDIAWSSAISADGREVAAGYWFGDVVLWQNSGDRPRGGVVLGTGRQTVNDIGFDPAGGILASGDSGGTITLWRLEKRGSPIRLEGHTGDVRSLAFSPDGRTLVSGADDGTVLLWDVKEGEALGEALRLGAPVTAVAFAPDGQSLLAVHAALTVWNTALWGPGDDTFEAVRQRFCALVGSETARSSAGDPCRRRG